MPEPAAATSWRDVSAGQLAVWAALAGTVALAAMLRIDRAWSDMRELVRHSVPDDAFYYFQIARNVVDGHGSTLDGETVTTGYHPLWLVVTLPSFLLDDRVLAVHVALTIGALLGAATALVVFFIVHVLVNNPRAALLGAFAFAIHPVFVRYSVNGLETSLSIFMVALATLVFTFMGRQPPPRRGRMYALLGATLGLATLARTDLAPLALFLPLVLAVREPGHARLRVVLLSGTASAVVIAPWLLWSLWATGSIIQDSALAGGYVARELYFAEHENALWPNVQHGLSLTRDMLVDELPGQFLIPFPDSTNLFWLVLAAGSVAIAFLPTSRRSETLSAFGLIAVPFAVMLGVLAVGAGIRWFTRSWYFAPLSVTTAISIGLIANYLEGALDDARHALSRWTHGQGHTASALPAWPFYACLYTVAAFAILNQFKPSKFDGLYYNYGWQPDVLDASAWLNENTPADARIAAYNAGMPAYFVDRPVVNLDGLVNRDAFEALRECRTRDYIRELAIDYVADSEPQFRITSCSLDLRADLVVLEEVGTVAPVLITIPRDPTE